MRCGLFAAAKLPGCFKNRRRCFFCFSLLAPSRPGFLDGGLVRRPGTDRSKIGPTKIDAKISSSWIVWRHQAGPRETRIVTRFERAERKDQ
jgi:hypothetical protein